MGAEASSACELLLLLLSHQRVAGRGCCLFTVYGSYAIVVGLLWEEPLEPCLCGVPWHLESRGECLMAGVAHVCQRDVVGIGCDSTTQMLP